MWQIPLAMAVGGGLLGAMKYGQDKKTEESDRRLAAETMRYSPWTGMRPGQIREANLMNNIMQGAMSGGMMGLNVGQMMQGNELMDAQKNWYQSNAAMGGQGPVMSGWGQTPYNQSFNQGQYGF